MAGLKGGSGPPGNMDAFKHGLAAIQKRREESVTTEHEESVRQQILDGLIAHKGGDEKVSTATRILAEVIASDAAWCLSLSFEVMRAAWQRRNVLQLAEFQRERVWPGTESNCRHEDFQSLNGTETMCYQRSSTE